MSAANVQDLWDSTSEHRATFERCLRRAEAGSLSVRVPVSRSSGAPPRIRHFHPQPEMFIQLQGTSRLSVPGSHVDIHSGEICVMPRWMQHDEHCRERPFRNVVVGFHMHTLWTHVAEEGEHGGPRVTAHIGVEVPRVQRFWDYLDDAVEASQGSGAAAKATMRGALMAFFASLVRALDGSLKDSAREHPKVARARQLIAEHLTDRELSVEGLAELVGCTADYLSHLFHSETGHRLTAYVNAQRIERAKRLLSSTEMNVSEIARACGYADAGYFARQFKRATGQTASTYRVQTTVG